METKTIELKKYNKLVNIANRYLKINDNSLIEIPIKRLRFLIKTKLPKEKHKYFNVINLYLQDTKNLYLSNYLLEIYNKLEDYKNQKD